MKNNRGICFLDNIHTRRKLQGMTMVLPTVIILVALILYPVITNLYLSFTNSNLLKSGSSFIGFQNYAKIFSDKMFSKYAWNTLIWTVFSVVGQLVVGFALALLISRQMRGGTFLRSFLLIPYVVPAVSIALIARWILNSNYGIVNHWLQNMGLVASGQSALSLPVGAMIVVIIFNIWRSYPFPMLIYWAALKGIDKELYEAANVDGANKLQVFLYITLPQLRNTTLTLLILRIAWTATYFDLIWMVTGGGPAGSTTQLPIMIYQNSFGTFQIGYAAAISVILGLILMVFVIAYIRRSKNFAD